jgi:hypothetical protein
VPINPETGTYYVPRYRSKFEAVRTVAACISSCGTLVVLLRVFGVVGAGVWEHTFVASCGKWWTHRRMLAAVVAPVVK